MSLKDLNRRALTKITSQLLDHVTCLECCKYYKCVCTAWCGHSLCASCWAGRRSCPTCGTARGRRPLADNAPLQALADHVAALAASYEKLFNITIQEFMLEADEPDAEMDPNKNVKLWLTSSQNHFSAPVTDSQDSQPAAPIQLSTSKIQIHTRSKKSTSPSKVLHVTPQQDDWDRIEVMPETEDIVARDKENVIGPMDLEPFLFNENEYNNDRPRRSLRKRENKNEVKEISVHSKTSDAGSEKKSTIAPQTWNNVKKMRKEFSKLNKKNKNKLNVSIEMCKKTQSSNKKATVTPPVLSQLPTYTIDENTPELIPTEANQLNLEQENNDKVSEIKSSPRKKQSAKVTDISLQEDMDIDYDNVIEKVNETNKIKENTPIGDNKKLTSQSKLNNDIWTQKKNSHTLTQFIKRGALCTQPSAPPPLDKPIGIVTKTVEPAQNPVSINTDNIEITIKIGSTITNIVINKKENDVKFKVNTDKEIQTTLALPNVANGPKTASTSTDSDVKNLEINICGKTAAQTQVALQAVAKSIKKDEVVKSTSTKKNTASAETATAQFEITDSVEREISNIMERVENKEDDISKDSKTTKSDDKTKLIPVQEETKEIPEDIQLLNEDIFASGSVKELPVQVLGSSNSARSEIFVSKSRTQKKKRHRDLNENENTQAKKKLKHIPQKNIKNATLPDSEGMNYDAVMGQVFASIDKDIEIIKSQNTVKNTQVVNTQILSKSTRRDTPAVVDTQMHYTSKSVKKSGRKQVDEKGANVKYSENIFSLLERDSELNISAPRGNNKQVPGPETQKHIEKLLTPGVCEELGSVTGDVTDAMTPAADDDDHSVVEETPQKNITIGNNTKQKADAQKPCNVQAGRIQSVINLVDSDTSGVKQNNTVVVHENKSDLALGTPLNINKFFDHVTYKSTPMARKSLNFNNEDADKTLCPTASVPQTTQEKEFLARAFESQNTTVKSPIVKKSDYCVAGSCLSAGDIAKIRSLCAANGWTFVDKYCDQLTHLIVGVDEEGRAQRSVKYMRALAASKWIVTIEWIERLINNEQVSEIEFEAVDMCGAPGPRLSREARAAGAGGLFAGITFRCLPPFSVLQLRDLEAMLAAAGGRVLAAEGGGGAGGGGGAALLLAEPDHTQEDRFIYLAMEGAVPVNFEWALNCLGAYSLQPPLLLCPAALLPAAAWPPPLAGMARALARGDPDPDLSDPDPDLDLDATTL